MTNRQGDDMREETLKALRDVWSRMDETFSVQELPFSDWTATVRESRRLARRKLRKELAVLWAIAIPVLGLMMLLAMGMMTLFWIVQAAATVACVPWLIAEFRRVRRADGRRSVP